MNLYLELVRQNTELRNELNALKARMAELEKPLMNPAYSGPLDTPSPAAIAVAKSKVVPF